MLVLDGLRFGYWAGTYSTNSLQLLLFLVFWRVEYSGEVKHDCFLLSSSPLTPNLNFYIEPGLFCYLRVNSVRNENFKTAQLFFI